MARGPWGHGRGATAAALIDAGLDEAWVGGPTRSCAGRAGLGRRLGCVPARRARESPASSRTRPSASRSSSSRCGSTPISTRRSARRSTSTRGSRARSRSSRTRSPSSGIEVVREYDHSLPRIEANAPELNQVWTNLIDNAIAAARERVTIRTSRSGDFISVEVEDDGAGVPPEIAERVFDAFFTTKEPGEGTGLGLDIARRIVVRHHGDLRLKPVRPRRLLPGAAAACRATRLLARSQARAS